MAEKRRFGPRLIVCELGPGQNEKKKANYHG